jgi:quercetin dioxygenase-like cupin family protein
MKQFVALLLLAGGFAGLTLAQGKMPAPVLPESLRWQGPPDIPALKAAWMLGAEQKPGPYILRVKLAENGLIPPHTHPDERNTSVLSGTIYVGFDATFDENKVVAVPAGAVYVAPANVPHYIWAKDGNAEYQEAGFGPTATEILGR